MPGPTRSQSRSGDRPRRRARCTRARSLARLRSSAVTTGPPTAGCSPPWSSTIAGSLRAHPGIRGWTRPGNHSHWDWRPGHRPDWRAVGVVVRWPSAASIRASMSAESACSRRSASSCTWSRGTPSCCQREVGLQQPVPPQHSQRHLLAGRGQPHAVVRTMIDQPMLHQPPNHVGRRGCRHRSPPSECAGTDPLARRSWLSAQSAQVVLLRVRQRGSNHRPRVPPAQAIHSDQTDGTTATRHIAMTKNRLANALSRVVARVKGLCVLILRHRNLVLRVLFQDLGDQETPISPPTSRAAESPEAVLPCCSRSCH